MSWFVYEYLGYDGGMITSFEDEEEMKKYWSEAKIEGAKWDESCGLIEGKLIEGVLE